MAYKDFTQEKKEVFKNLLEDKLKWWIENDGLKIEWSDNGVALICENTMHGSIVADASELVRVFRLISYITCRMMSIVMKIY